MSDAGIDDEKERIRNEFAALAIAAGVEPRFVDNYYELIFEIATGLVSRSDQLTIVGISGAQGTGKSTFARMLAIALERAFEKATLVMSLDDFYLTREERIALARDVHPLLKVRGVPGTHDVALLSHVLADIRAGRNTEVPVFDKATDDRQGFVPVVSSTLSFVVFEGWCLGARPVAESDLDPAINALEREQDADGSWRRYVNRQLSEGGYQQVFANVDVMFFLAAPDMETIYNWRLTQERELAQRRDGPAIMDAGEVREFIMYYERITRRMVANMPAEANLTLYLDDRHQPTRPPKT